MALCEVLHSVQHVTLANIMVVSYVGCTDYFVVVGELKQHKKIQYFRAEILESLYKADWHEKSG